MTGKEMDGKKYICKRKESYYYCEPFHNDPERRINSEISNFTIDDIDVFPLAIGYILKSEGTKCCGPEIESWLENRKQDNINKLEERLKEFEDSSSYVHDQIEEGKSPRVLSYFMPNPIEVENCRMDLRKWKEGRYDLKLSSPVDENGYHEHISATVLGELNTDPYLKGKTVLDEEGRAYELIFFGSIHPAQREDIVNYLVGKKGVCPTAIYF